MAKEFKLSFSAEEVEEKLQKIDNITDAIYIQDEEPEDAITSSIWVDTSSDGMSTPEKTSANVFVVDARTNDISTVDFTKFAVGDVIVVTTS